MTTSENTPSGRTGIKPINSDKVGEALRRFELVKANLKFYVQVDASPKTTIIEVRAGGRLICYAADKAEAEEMAKVLNKLVEPFIKGEEALFRAIIASEINDGELHSEC